MKQAIEDVREFHQKFGFPGAKELPPNMPEKKVAKMWLRLVMEEFLETFAATLQHAEDDKTFTQIRFHMESALSSCEVNEGNLENLSEIADGLADLIYVAIGMARTLGIPLEEVWDEVHKTNMAKEGGPVRGDGKILKPPGWKPPAVKTILKEAEGRLG